jgi:uncharacterized protein (TIGR02246 family)
VILLLAALTATCTHPPKDIDADFDAFLDVYTAIWNEHDGVALSALFTTDADLIVGNLPRIDGREAIGEWWDGYFSRLDNGRKGEFELLSIREIAPGIGLVNIRSKTLGTASVGEVLDTRLARGTWVVVKTDGTWLITSMRALPAEGEDRFRPGEDR